VKKTSDFFSTIKSNNYLGYAMAAKWAVENGLDDTLLTNTFDRVADATIANVFIVTDGVIKTPLLTEGCVSGVMRKYLLNCFEEDSIPFSEAKISCNELLNASEVFLTNAIYGIRWVQKVGTSNYKNSSSALLHTKFILPLFSSSTF
jgi:branched-chain amino acid aminotransferase